MKYCIILLPLLLSILSCSKEEVDFESNLIGEWQINSFVVNCDDPSSSQPLITGNDGCIDMFGLQQCQTIALAEDGTGMMRQSIENDVDIYEQAITYTANKANNTLEICYDNVNCQEFSYSDGRLITDVDENDCICTMGYRK